jgi:hypothetical protein
MPRIRTIDPHFPRTPSLSRLSREARLCFILLWTLADDRGRLVLAHQRLKEQLNTVDDDAMHLLPAWLQELDTARCIEIYRVDEVDYLRVRKWRELQTIDRPTPSRLPAGPSERTREPREPREESPRMQAARASEGIAREDAISATDEGETGDPDSITSERLLADLDIYLRRARRKEKLDTADTRIFDLAGRRTGLWAARAASSNSAGRSAPADSGMSPSPAEIHGLPATGS